MEILFVRLPQEFATVKQDFNSSLNYNAEWNSMIDISDVLSKFLNTTIKPIAIAIENDQTKRARSVSVQASEMWDTTSYEDMQKARVGEPQRAHRAQPDSGKASTQQQTSKKRKANDGNGAANASRKDIAYAASDTATGKSKGKGKGKGKADGGTTSKGKSIESKGKGGSKGKEGKGKSKGYPKGKAKVLPSGLTGGPMALPILPDTLPQMKHRKRGPTSALLTSATGNMTEADVHAPIGRHQSSAGRVAITSTRKNTKAYGAAKDNNQRMFLGKLIKEGRVQVQAHRATATLPADPSYGSGGLQGGRPGDWVRDANAKGGWRWASPPEAEEPNTLQMDEDAPEEPENDKAYPYPYERANAAGPS